MTNNNSDFILKPGESRTTYTIRYRTRQDNKVLDMSFSDEVLFLKTVSMLKDDHNVEWIQKLKNVKTCIP